MRRISILRKGGRGQQALTSGTDYNMSVDKVALTIGLHALTCGSDFSRSLDEVALPRLQALTCIPYAVEKDMELA